MSKRKKNHRDPIKRPQGPMQAGSPLHRLMEVVAAHVAAACQTEVRTSDPADQVQAARMATGSGKGATKARSRGKRKCH
jgi:hypothetical protein